jgi:hypothetical protein
VIVLIAAVLAAQDPAAVQPTPAPVEVVGNKKKRKQHCQLIDVSGSRMRQRVCTDDSTMASAGPNVTDDGTNPGMVHAMPGAAVGAPGGMGSPPK